MKKYNDSKLVERQKRKFFFTEKGFKKIKKDLQILKEMKKAEGKKAPKTFNIDDLDPEYLDFQHNAILLEAKIAHLEFVVDNAKKIKPPKNIKEIGIGAKILVEIDGDHEDEYTILGTMEANPSLGIISNESPVGRALMGHKEGDKVELFSPVKTFYKIKKVWYTS